MSEHFVVKQKRLDRGADRHFVISLRIEEDILEAFEKLSGESERSRNKLMCMALRYALEHLEFVDEESQL